MALDRSCLNQVIDPTELNRLIVAAGFACAISQAKAWKSCADVIGSRGKPPGGA